MRRSLLLILLLGLTTLATAQAEPLPPEILNAQYQTCLAQIANNNDGVPLTTKQNYCACVRDTLASKWDTRRLSAMAQQPGGLNEHDRADIDAMGRGCAIKALK